MHKVFQQEVQRQAGVLLNYPFNNRLNVGDYGTIDKNGHFSRRGNIIEDIPSMKVREYAKADSYRIMSASGVTIDITSDVDTAPAKVNLDVAFADKDSIFLNLGPQTVHEIESVERLASYIRSLVDSKMWDFNNVIVTTVYSSKNVVLAGSSSLNAKISFGTKLSEGAVSDVLKKVEVNWSVGAHSNTGMYYNSESETDMLFKAHKMVRRFITNKVVLIPLIGKYMGIGDNDAEYHLEQFSII